jgi:hypothetical protein
MWAWLKCVENETGQAKEDVHDHYCKLFLKREITINGKNEVVVGGTRSLSTVEMADFLKKVQVDVAVEFGIILPIPEDKAFEDFMNNY